MGYAIQIRRLNDEGKDLTIKELAKKNDEYELDDISEKIANLYMSYNHYNMFNEFEIYPRDFTCEKVKDILPKYKTALEKLKADEGVDQVIVKLYEESEDYYDFQEKCEIDYFEKSKTVIFIIVSEVIETLKKCDDNDLWFSD